MAHFAQLDENNIVIQVITADNKFEETGEEFFASEVGGVWKKTSYNTYANVHKLDGIPFRKNYAGPGYKYDEVRDAFIPPKRYPSWVLNEDTCLWEPPIPYPGDEGDHGYFWSEELLDWVNP